MKIITISILTILFLINTSNAERQFVVQGVVESGDKIGQAFTVVAEINPKASASSDPGVFASHGYTGEFGNGFTAYGYDPGSDTAYRAFSIEFEDGSSYLVLAPEKQNDETSEQNQFGFGFTRLANEAVIENYYGAGAPAIFHTISGIELSLDQGAELYIGVFLEQDLSSYINVGLSSFEAAFGVERTFTVMQDPRFDYYTGDHIVLESEFLSFIGEPLTAEVIEAPSLLTSELPKKSGALEIDINGNMVTLAFESEEGKQYLIEKTNDLESWIDIDLAISGDGSQKELNFPLSGTSTFYRLSEVTNTSISVSISGQVNAPDQYSLSSENAFLTFAIASARGISRLGDPQKVQIARQTELGQAVLEVDFRAITDGEQPDIQLLEGDTVFVPERPF